MEKVGIFFTTILIFGPASAKLPNFPKSLANSPSVTSYLFPARPLTPPFDHRIVGGEIADDGEFPYQVSIQRYHSKENDTGSEVIDKGFHFCGGSIVSPRVIISAGHCADGQDHQKVRICVGTNRLGSEYCHNLLIVAKIIVHEDYNGDDINNDISAFILQDRLEFSEVVSPVTLPTPEGDKENTMCVVSGWGTTEEGGSVSEELRYVEVPITSVKYCRDSYGEKEITDSMLCAGLENGGKDSCQGDSGGPMVIKGSHTLVGIVSWGYGCARPNYPGVYTRVLHFNSWIEEKVASYP